MKKYLTIIWLVAILLGTPVVGGSNTLLTGTVLDSEQEPIPGATVALLHGDSLLTGAIADQQGQWSLQFSMDLSGLELRTSAIGFSTSRCSLDTVQGSAVRTTLRRKTIEVDGVSVTPLADPDFSKLHLGSTDVNRLSRQSLVPSNPTAAIVEPAVVREGSQHSSKIRVHGAAPDYHINGVNIGADPHHYGAFTIIPSSVVENLRLHTSGTKVDHATPSALELSTTAAFSSPLSGEFGMSPLEATGALSIGSDRVFALASLRKSVLDKLVNRLDIHSDRRTLPPTNFEDIFISTGLRISDRQTLILDQYHVQDFLSYATFESPLTAGGVSIFQHTKDSYLGLRYRYRLSTAEIRARLSGRQSKEIYRASPSTGDADVFRLDLSEHRRSYSALLEADIEVTSNHILSMGGQVERVARRDLRMSQKNWNFLPPDASSDLPHPYQPELNSVYADIDLDDSEANGALWSSLGTAIGRLDVEAGVRLDLFNSLSSSAEWSPRLQATLPVGEEQAVELALGAYAENPVSRVLQSYQVLIRYHSRRLEPIRSLMASVAYQWRNLRLSGFAKQISDQPVVHPDYSVVSRDGAADSDFLRMESCGRSTFAGANLTFEFSRPWEWPISVYGFYGYSHATSRSAGVSVPHELDAPHRFFLQLGCQASRRLQLGADLAVRSGYPYSSATASMAADRYTTDWWQRQLASQNTRRFPTNISLSLHGEINLGRFRVNLNVANLTDHGNPMINTSDGYIYDAGILPSLGMSYRL